jgi:tRNA (guanosine-2'-O-)-methyltransferase
MGAKADGSEGSSAGDENAGARTAPHVDHPASSSTAVGRTRRHQEGVRQLRGKPLTDFLRRVQRPDLDLVFVLQDVQDPVNVGSAFRIADAVGVTRMVLTGITTRPPHALIKKVGRGRDRRVAWDYQEDAAETIGALREQGYRTVAVEITAQSVPYDQAEYGDRVALVVGHEDHGVTNRSLAACDLVVYLPMFGKGASLNVHVSLGAVAYHVVSASSRLTLPPDRR